MFDKLASSTLIELSKNTVNNAVARWHEFVYKLDITPHDLLLCGNFKCTDSDVKYHLYN